MKKEAIILLILCMCFVSTKSQDVNFNNEALGYLSPYTAVYEAYNGVAFTQNQKTVKINKKMIYSFRNKNLNNDRILQYSDSLLINDKEKHYQLTNELHLSKNGDIKKHISYNTNNLCLFEKHNDTLLCIYTNEQETDTLLYLMKANRISKLEHGDDCLEYKYRRDRIVKTVLYNDFCGKFVTRIKYSNKRSNNKITIIDDLKTSIYTYSQNKIIEKRVTYNLEKTTSVTEYTYDKKGNLSQTIKYRENKTGSRQVFSNTYCFYDKEGLLTSKNTMRENAFINYSYYYNDMGNLSFLIVRSQILPSNESKRITIDIYKYEYEYW
jgi:hypothetical protein